MWQLHCRMNRSHAKVTVQSIVHASICNCKRCASAIHHYLMVVLQYAVLVQSIMKHCVMESEEHYLQFMLLFLIIQPCLQYIFYLSSQSESHISYLPLSHIAGQVVDIIIPALVGSCVWFAQPDALKGSLKQTILVSEPLMQYQRYSLYVCTCTILSVPGTDNAHWKSYVN